MNMTNRWNGAISRQLAAAVIAGSATLSGCASTEQPGIAPQAGALDTGTYPNLNVPPERAAETMTAEDASSLAAQVDGARGRQAASGRGAGTKGDPQMLKRLAAQHGDDTLAAINAGE
jgi:hypothetical protein